MLNCTVFKINKYQNVKRAYINKKTKKILRLVSSDLAHKMALTTIVTNQDSAY